MELELRSNPKETSATESDDPFEWEDTFEPVLAAVQRVTQIVKGEQEPSLKKEGVRLDLYDPKYSTRYYIPDGYYVVEHDSAAEAIKAGYESGENGVILLEELNTIPRTEWETIRYYFSIRRRGVDNTGPAIYGTCQRPVDMPPVFKKIGDHMFCGKLTDPDDIKTIKGPTDLEFVTLLPTLTPDPKKECEFYCYVM